MTGIEAIGYLRITDVNVRITISSKAKELGPTLQQEPRNGEKQK